MITHALLIREAILARLVNLAGMKTPWKLCARTPSGTQDPATEFPRLGVYLLRERMGAEGQGNQGAIRYEHDATISMSIAHWDISPDELETDVDDRVSRILAALLNDNSFTRGPGPVRKKPGETWAPGDLIYWDPAANIGTLVALNNWVMGTATADAVPTANTGKVNNLFESVDGVSQDRFFPEGERHFHEIRLSMTFQFRTDWFPTIVDDFLVMHIETRYPTYDTDPAEVQQVIAQYELQQQTKKEK